MEIPRKEGLLALRERRRGPEAAPRGMPGTEAERWGGEGSLRGGSVEGGRGRVGVKK